MNRAGSHTVLRYLIGAAIAIAVFAILTPDIHAQYYFGKNKVQYDSFDWQVMTTEHFKIYFYTDEEEIAHIGAQIAEEAYNPLAARFNHEVKRKIPLILYSAPRYFAQTNVTAGMLPESVGGFTEFLKGRVVVPYHGSYFDFKHVITHELVHVFTLSKIAEQGSRRGIPRQVFPPLWFMEGIAEYWSEDWDTEADMMIKDMVLNGQLLSIPEFWRVHGSYFMYKLGQSVCEFINDEYGADKLTYIFENWTRGRTFEKIVEHALGDNFTELSRKWEYSLQKRYFPEMDSLGFPDMESERLTYDRYCVKGVPINWDDGKGTDEWLVYMAFRRGYAGLYLKPRAKNGKGRKTLVKGETSVKFESLYMLRSGIDATDSGLVVFSSKSKGKDVVYVYDLNEMKITGEHVINGLVAVRSPRFSPDLTQVAFTGIKVSGHSDIYLLDLTTGEYHSVTNDIYNDLDPTFTLDSRRLLFASDRSVEGKRGASNLFEVDLHDHAIRQLTWGDYHDQTPDATEHGVYFSSNRADSYNLFLLDHDGQITRQSTYATGALDPRLSSDGTTLTYSGYQNMGFQVYQMDLTPEPEPIEVADAGPPIASWEPSKIDTEFRNASVKYDVDYSLDIAQSMIAYDPIYGSVGGIQVALSDVLGDHSYYVLLTNTADTKDEFLSSFNIGVTYINRKKRINWGIGAFHLYDEYFNDADQYYYQRQAGAIGLVSYPVSKFSRFDLTTFARHEHKDRRYGLRDRKGFVATSYLSWVYDNSIWDLSGPIEGRRYNLSVGFTHSFTEGRGFNRVAFADIRHYLRLGSASAFANRLYGFTSSGVEPQRVYFGGSWSFRGYDRRAFYNRNIIFASNELRFPLIDALLIGFPIGGLGFQGIRGALFFDVGSAWDDEYDELLGSYGAGFRVGLGYLVVLRFDFAKRTDFETTSHGWDFDFFFGWNF